MSPLSLSPTDAPRMIAGRYELIEERGLGPRTALFAALDHALSRRVLVRLFVADATDLDRLRQQEAEVRRLASFEHPALTRLFDAGIDTQPDGRPVIFFVSDHHDGFDLDDAVARAPMTPVQVADLGADLTDALALLHTDDRVHSRISPANILVRPSRDSDRTQGTLIDIESGFVAQVLPGSVTGDRPAPAFVGEGARGLDEEPSPAQDVYALGFCLAYALRGATPIFHADGRLRVGVLTARPLGEILRRMMAPLPADRLTAAEASAALRDYALSEVPVAASAQNGARDDTEASRANTVLASEPDELFTRITRLAGSITDSPISMLYFVTDDIAIPRGASGVDVELGTPLHAALCGLTTRLARPWSVADIRNDPRTEHITLPLPADQVTSYAAAPLLTHDGESVGSLCVFSADRREYSDDDLHQLQQLAAIAMRDVELSATGRRSRDLSR